MTLPSLNELLIKDTPVKQATPPWWTWFSWSNIKIRLRRLTCRHMFDWSSWGYGQMAGEIDLYCPKCGKIAHRVNLLGMPEEYQQKVLTVLKMLRDRRNN